MNLAFLHCNVSIIIVVYEKLCLKCANQSKSSGWGNLADRPCTFQFQLQKQCPESKLHKVVN